MKTDSIFYQVFLALPQAFFDLIGRGDAKRYRFVSIELKQTAFRLDGVFLPRSKRAPIYFLEIQFQRSRRFYARFFAEIFLYLYQHRVVGAWQAVVIYPSRQAEAALTGVYAELARRHLRRIYLDELAELKQPSLGVDIIKLVVAPENKVVDAAKRLIRQTQTTRIGKAEKQRLAEFIETIVIYKFPNLTREEIEAMLNLPSIRHTRVYKDAVSEGLEKGLREGEANAKKAVALRLYERGMSAAEIADVLQMPLAEVKRITQKGKKKKTKSE